ncbi:hypothetical protein UlMin_022443 [Ulmus minor]
MAESAVTFLVEKLSSLLEKEANLLGGVRNEVVEVRDELERIKAFLRTADASEDEDEEIKVWVKQVREVAYDAEDILDEFLYRFGAHQRPGLYGYLIKMARTIKTLKARRRIASQLASIKTRVTTISDGHQRYGPISGSSSSGSAGNYTLCELRSDARLLEEAQLVGIEQPKQKLKDYLFNEASSLGVVAVVGMGGLGKTTLANQVYKDSEVNKHFQHHVWITVSQSFKLEELLKKIIQQLFDSIRQSQPQGTQSNDSHELKQIIRDFLRERRFLVVLDDVWEVQSWHALKHAFPEHNCNGSRLLLTTRNTKVASTSTREFRGDSYHLEPLSEKESWSLFCKKLFQGNPCPSHLETISRDVLKRCEGLPLGIVAISGVLSSKDINKIEEWNMVYSNLGAELEGNVKRILSLSFNDLPYNLKSCFLYLSLFPEDFTFYFFDILRLWIAEGFVQEMKGRTLEEVGESYFNELLNRSLVQLAADAFVKEWNRFKIHDLVREIVLAKAEDQNFAAIVSAKNPRLPEKVRRLSMCTPLKNLRGDYNFSRLRSLHFFPLEDDSASSFSMSAFFDGGLRLLKVLNCQKFPNFERFPEGITKLYNLRFLSLEGTEVTSVPPSIGKLRNLETLDLTETHVEELPAEILKLRRLRHIKVFRSLFNDRRFDQCDGFKAPLGIETLTSLQTLVTINASPGGVDFIGSLGMLKQLRNLEIQELGAEHGAALCSSIQKLSFLRRLSMETREEDEVLDLHNIASPALQCLQQLYMHGCLKVLPNWVSKLSSLVVLQLRWSKLEVDPLESLQALPNLAVLKFQKAYGGDALCLKAGGFQMLKYLEFCSLGKLRQVTIEKGAVLRLEELVFEDCKLLEQVPSGLEFLTNLKKLWFVDVADELVIKNRDDYDNVDLETYHKIINCRNHPLQFGAHRGAPVIHHLN